MGVTGVGSESYWGGRVIEESWGEDEGPDCIVCGGGEKAGSIGRPGGWLEGLVKRQLGHTIVHS